MAIKNFKSFFLKTLIIVRHAKSSWEDVMQNDFDRPLNERGKEEAPIMGKRLANKKINIDVFVSSPAKRAYKTAKLFIKEFDRSKDEILLVKELYEASVTNFQQVVKSLDNKFDSAAIFSHNPGITDFANSLSLVKIDNMPTSGIFAVKASVKKWSDFNSAIKEFLFFDYPKNIL